MENELEKEERRLKNAYMLDEVANTRCATRTPWAMFYDYPRYCVHKRENAMCELLHTSGFQPDKIAEKTVLDVGCGDGNVLRDFIKYSANPKNLYGIDLIQERIWKAKDLTPSVNFKCGNAATTDYVENSFDLILCFTLFSSILHEGIRVKIADNIKKWIKPNGIIVVYDMNESINSETVKGLTPKQLYDLFGGLILTKQIIAKNTGGVWNDNDEKVCFVAVIKDVKNA